MGVDVTEPLVTVIMAVLNGESWLPSSVPDVLNQTMGDLELLVIDDGSTDGTRDVLAGFNDPRIRVVSLEHVGLAPALNHGIKLAAGRYIARMDVDDRSHPTRLELQLAAAKRDPDVVAVGCTFEVLDPDGEVRGVIAPPIFDDDIRRRLLIRNPFAAGSMLFDTAALRDVGGYVEEYTSAEDYEVLVRLARRGRLSGVPDALYGWRVHPGNMSLRLRERELRTVTTLHDALWSEVPAPRRRREFSARLNAYVRGDPTMGTVIAAQLLQTEILITLGLFRRGHPKVALRQLFAIALISPNQWLHLLRTSPASIARALGQRSRARRKPAAK
jgi:glycosyltransferase involved in cell wall biosynthesis